MSEPLTAAAPANPALGPKRLRALTALAGLGVLISIYLTFIHLTYLSTGVPSVCNLGEKLNCDAVNSSPWSEVWGIPVSHLGLLFYATLLLLLLAVRQQRHSGPTASPLQLRLHLYLVGLAKLSVLTSIYFAYVSLALIKAICLFCTGLYAVNLLLFLVLLPGALPALGQLGTQLPRGIAEDLRLLLRQPIALRTVLVLLIGGVASGFVLHQETTRLHAQEVAKVIAATASLAQRQSGQSPTAPAPIQRIDLSCPTAPSFGPENAPITLVEVSDFECPFCQRAAGTIEELQAAYPGKLRLVFRHYPLDQACNPNMKRPLHERACELARAGFCAHQQGQFFPIAKRFFAGDNDAEDVATAVRELGLNKADFERCLASPESLKAVQADIAAAAQAGVAGVPVFLVNGRIIKGAQPIAVFRKLIDEELAAATASK